MKKPIAIGAGLLALSIAASAASSQDSREYHRGYYDCLAGRFDREENDRAYRAGCRAAHEQEREGGGYGEDGEGCRDPYGDCRDEGPPPRHMPRPPWGPGPVMPRPVEVPNAGRPVGGLPNVKGMDPAKALGVMASHGFRNVAVTPMGPTIFGIYYNPATHECVALAHTNGLVSDVREIGSHPKCH